MTEVLLAAKGKNGAPATLDEYRAAGGYQALEKALKDCTPADLVQMVKDSGLRGRGGAGFPSGMKWSFVATGDKADGGPKYLVVNADEMEPGTFKDRVLMERNPHILIEGIILASYGMEMTDGMVFIRREYFKQADILERAIDEARRAGILGSKVMGRTWSFDIMVHRSGGRYICGEETALLNAFEGKKAQPRSKPPFPATRGLWGRPSTVHNVETLSCVPGIVKNGAEWFKKLAKNPDGAGTKLYGGSGKLAHPQCVERGIGATLRELLADMGGIKDGKKLLAFLPGGASTSFLTADHLDVPMDYNPLAAAGSSLGTGTFMVLTEDDCPVRAAVNLQRFFARESCGFCTPCRDGLPYGLSILERIENGTGTMHDLDWMQDLYRNIGPNSFCALATGAAIPMKGLYEHFRPILEEHVKLGRCTFPKSAVREVAHA